MAKFNTLKEAQAAGEALFRAGKCNAWSFYSSWGKWIVRVQVNGRWFNLLQAEV